MTISHLRIHVAKGRRRASVNSRASGLDWSKTHPTSLFYLPCQAQEPEHSFFVDHREDGRQPLQPSIWIRNATIPLQPELEPAVQPGALGDAVDEALVERAKEAWRGSTGQPGRGNQMFFNLALSLRRAGMSRRGVEHTLRSQAESGRHPKERKAQIPSILASLHRFKV